MSAEKWRLVMADGTVRTHEVEWRTDRFGAWWYVYLAPDRRRATDARSPLDALIEVARAERWPVVEFVSPDAETRAERAAAPPCPECNGRRVVTYPPVGDDDCPACGPTVALTVRPAETLSRLVGLLLVERAAHDAYDATEGRPWSVRIAAKVRWDAAREAWVAEMTGTNGGER